MLSLASRGWPPGASVGPLPPGCVAAGGGVQVNRGVEVTWEDLRKRQILAKQKFPISPDVIRQTAQASFAPEVGQSLATANRQALDSLARNIVDMMEAPW